MTRLAARDASTRASNAVPAAAREAVDVDVASPMKFSAWGSGMTPGDLDELRASFQRDGFCILRLDQHLNDDVGHYVDDAKRWEFDEVIEALRFECDALAEGVDLRANDCMVEPMEDVAVDEKRKRKRDARRREKSYDDSDGFGRFYCDCEHQSTSPSPHREREACSARRCGKYFLEKRMTRVAAYLHARARPDRSAFGDYTISHRNEGNSFAMREGRTRMMPNEEDPKYSFEAIHARAVCDALDAVLFRWLPSIAKVFLRSKAAYLFNQHYVVKPGVCADAAEYYGDDEDGGDRFEWHTDANEQLALLPNPDARKQKYVSLWCPLDAVDERNGSLVLRPSERPSHHDDGSGRARGRKDVTVRAEAGDVVIFSSDLWHASGPNRSRRERRVFYAQYSGEPITTSGDATKECDELSLAIRTDAHWRDEADVICEGKRRRFVERDLKVR